MKILINGVYIGGNCPPTYHYLKQLGHDVKIIDGTYFKQYNNFSDLIDKNDIIFPDYSLIDFCCFKLYQKTTLDFLLIPLKKKIGSIIDSFVPDIIIDHQLSLRANLFLATGFKPQIGFIYGSEIKGKNIHKKAFKRAIEKIDYVVTTMPSFKETVIKKFPVAANKSVSFLYSFFEYKKILAFTDNITSAELRKEYGFSEKDIILFDNRSLRDEEVLKEALHDFLKAYSINNNFKFILVKGFSGNKKLVEYTQKFILENNCNNCIQIIDSSLSEEEHFRYIKMSNAVCSLLRTDQFGEVIMHAMIYKKALILYELPQYKEVFENNAYYINEQSESFFKQLIQLQNNAIAIDFDHNFNYALNNFDAIAGFKKINVFLESTRLN